MVVQQIVHWRRMQVRFLPGVNLFYLFMRIRVFDHALFKGAICRSNREFASTQWLSKIANLSLFLSIKSFALLPCREHPVFEGTFSQVDLWHPVVIFHISLLFMVRQLIFTVVVLDNHLYQMTGYYLRI